MHSDDGASSLVGSTIANKYRLLRLLGAGGMGAVYEAEHVFTKRHVALKRMLPSLARSKQAADRFIREVQAPSTIGHPGIVQVLDGGIEPDGSLYLVLELLEGISMQDALDEGPLHEAAVTQIGIELLEALAAAHAKGFVHRDIKPDNVFLAQDGRGGVVVKLLDFGIASMRDTEGSHKLTRTGAVLGTPLYMSPEQAQGAQIDARSDLWSVGALLYRALAGAPPYDGDTYNALIVSIVTKPHAPLEYSRPDLPPDMLAVVERAMKKAPGERFQTAEQMCEALRVVNFDQHGQSEPPPSAAMSRVRSVAHRPVGAPEVAAGAETRAGRPVNAHGAEASSVAGLEVAARVRPSGDGAGARFDPHAEGPVNLAGAKVQASALALSAPFAVASPLGARSPVHGTAASLAGSADVARVLARTALATSSEEASRALVRRVAIAASVGLALAAAALVSLGGVRGSARDATARLPETAAAEPAAAELGPPRAPATTDASGEVRLDEVSRRDGAAADLEPVQVAERELPAAARQGAELAPDVRLQRQLVPAVEPAAPPSAANAGAGLPREALAQVMTEHQAELQHCLEETVVTQMLAGAQRAQPLRLDVELSVASSGRVERVELQGKAPAELTQCVRAQLSAARFPRAEAPTQFRYPLVLAATIVGQ